MVWLLEFLSYRLSDAVFFLSELELADAVQVFRLDRKRCFFVPHIANRREYNPPQQINLQDVFTIIFFGDFSYLPNRLGLNKLLNNIVPLLGDRIDFDCRLVVFGSNISESLPKAYSRGRLSVTMLDYVEDIDQRVQTSHLMVNPVSTGAGVQTKIVECISLGTDVVAARSGIQGINVPACGAKLHCVTDDDWLAFVNKIIEIQQHRLYLAPCPDTFFSTYSEGNVMATVLSALNTIHR